MQGETKWFIMTFSPIDNYRRLLFTLSLSLAQFHSLCLLLFLYSVMETDAMGVSLGGVFLGVCLDMLALCKVRQSYYKAVFPRSLTIHFADA